MIMVMMMIMMIIIIIITINTDVKYKTFTGEITLHITQIVNAEQLQYPGNMVRFRYIIVNILRNADNKGENNIL